MKQSFYHWLMTQRNEPSHHHLAQLAELVFYESHFPKQSTDFDVVSRFLEEEASFSFRLDQFDRIWEHYQDECIN